MRRQVAHLAAASVIAVGLAACGSGVTDPVPTTGIPMCDALPTFQADPALYRDHPIYVVNEAPTDQVRAWAAARPGFEELWLDPDHLRWITVAFSRDAAARQAELRSAFPDAGVVAVQVPWTMAELRQLQARVIEAGPTLVRGAGIRPDKGVVTISAGVLKPEVVRALDAKFGGGRVCLEGIDPADAPAERPQQSAGAGWRLVADEDEAGLPYRTGIAADVDSLARLWHEVGLRSPLPTVDFTREVVVWFGAVHGSSCPRLRLDDVRYDRERGVLHSVITSLDIGVCTADAIGHAYVVAVDRSVLPAGPFRIQLQAEDPPPGALDTEPTIVDADLSVPGSSLSEGQIQRPTATPFTDPYRIQPGDYLEQDEARRLRLDTTCGIEWLGRFDGYAWRTEAPHAVGFVPGAWQAAVDADGTIDLWITLRGTPSAHIDAVAANVTVTYIPTTAELPSCP